MNSFHSLHQQSIPEKKSVCVILHLYYQDLWEWFVPYLKNITTDFDLFVTTNEGSQDFNLEQKVKSTYPNAYFKKYPNRGLDVAPFLDTVNEIIQSGKTYNCVLKLHGKKSLAHGVELGNRWRHNLVSSLLSSPEKFQLCFNSIVENPIFKMAGSGVWVLPQNLLGYEQEYFDQSIHFDEYSFVAGTMFMVDFELLVSWIKDNKIYERFYPQFQDGYIGDGSIAHHLERIFGCLIKIKGFSIYYLISE